MRFALRTRLHAALAAVFLPAATATFVFVASPAAQADCAGRGNPTYLQLRNSAGIEIAYELYQYASTCDGDSEYRGKVKDSYTDGSCAYTYYYDTSRTTHGISCTTGGWSNYTFWDRQSNSSASVELAVDYRSTGRQSTWGF
ncbi:hypothetical protein [Micromonospora arida]|uniref:hypothetical protein n=1 Tax=Micromonospora arida TaxID=2203715 RepID=UPI0033D97E75